MAFNMAFNMITQQICEYDFKHDPESIRLETKLETTQNETVVLFALLQNKTNVRVGSRFETNRADICFVFC